MVEKVDKRTRAALFRGRIAKAIQQIGTTQSELARRAGVDRSTLSQLLNDDGARMPNGQLVAECAAALGVSADWLLGLSEFPEQATTLLAEAMLVVAWFSAVPPKTVIHRTQTVVGMINTQMMNSRTVRPRLTRAMNMPTKGDQEIHQAQ